MKLPYRSIQIHFSHEEWEKLNDIAVNLSRNGKRVFPTSMIRALVREHLLKESENNDERAH